MNMEQRSRAEERLLASIDAREGTCAVIGLGFIGSILMDAIAHAGFRARGYDRSPEAVERFTRWMEQRHPRPGAQWSASTDPDGFAAAEVVVVAVRALPRADGSVDLEPLESAARLVREHGVESRLVIVESTVPCGTTRCFAESLGARPGWFVAHSPERLSVGHDREVFRRVPHVVGGLDPAAGRVGARFLGALCDRVVPVSSPEVSELGKLFENAFLTTGIALANEITRLAHAAGVAAEEVCAAAATKPFGYYPFYPGPGLGGHCLGNDLAILRASSRKLGAPSELLDAIAEASAAGPATVLRRLSELLRAEGLEFRGSRILLAGVGFKPGTGDTTETPAREIARELRARGAEVAYLDGLVPEFAVDGTPLPRVEGSALGESEFTAAVVVSGDAGTPLERLAACAQLVFDARGRSSEARPEAVHTL